MKHTTSKGQAGFTLVELAIVMIVVGLLIGGVLKGQELITNAQVNAQVAQVKSFSTAISAFKDSFGALPGDILNANTRLPDCGTAPCYTKASAAGTIANGRIDNGTNTAMAGIPVTFADAPSTTNPERHSIWAQLATANLISGIATIQGGTADMNWGGSFPGGKIRGTGFDIGFNDGADGNKFFTDIVAPRPGHYIAIVSGPADGNPAPGLTPGQAARIDEKMDDGVPSMGDVIAGGTSCSSGTDETATYIELELQKSCLPFIRIQN